MLYYLLDVLTCARFFQTVVAWAFKPLATTVDGESWEESQGSKVSLKPCSHFLFF